MNKFIVIAFLVAASISSCVTMLDGSRQQTSAAPSDATALPGEKSTASGNQASAVDTSIDGRVDSLLEQIQRPKKNETELPREAATELDQQRYGKKVIFCEETIKKTLAQNGIGDSLQIRKKLQFGTFITTSDRSNTFFLFITPIGVFSSETISKPKYGESFSCFEDGEYFQILTESRSM